jgi:hypothetical protein
VRSHSILDGVEAFNVQVASESFTTANAGQGLARRDDRCIVARVLLRQGGSSYK